MLRAHAVARVREGLARHALGPRLHALQALQLRPDSVREEVHAELGRGALSVAGRNEPNVLYYHVLSNRFLLIVGVSPLELAFKAEKQFTMKVTICDLRVKVYARIYTKRTF